MRNERVGKKTTILGKNGNVWKNDPFSWKTWTCVMSVLEKKTPFWEKRTCVMSVLEKRPLFWENNGHA